MKFKVYHVPVMKNKAVDYLNVKPDGVYFDGTLGGGGHAEEILRRLNGGRLIAVDRDSDAIIYAAERLEPYRNKLTVLHDNYTDAARILDNLNIKLDGAILDLGISSHQIDEPSRGFSYMQDGPLDMRMDRTQFLTAFNVVNEYSEGELMRIIRDYGEEQNYRRLAAAIVRARSKEPIRTTLALAKIAEAAAPGRPRGGHPAKKLFQAIRIEVNSELSDLRQTVRDLAARLNKGGRLVIISFHSLEDRAVKEEMRLLATDCICDKRLPLCVCGHKAELKLIAKAETADEDELNLNKRAQSAKLRAAEKV